jgi:hypothetical protein
MIPGPILKKLCYNLYLFLLLLLLFVVKTCSDVPYDYCDKPNERCVDFKFGPRCKCDYGYEWFNGYCRGKSQRLICII